MRGRRYSSVAPAFLIRGYAFCIEQPNTVFKIKILVENSLPDIRSHDLRHTFATHALANGVDAKTLSGILVHIKASFTVDTYTHTISDMHRKAAEIVGGFLTDYLGEKMALWQSTENTETAASTREKMAAGRAGMWLAMMRKVSPLQRMCWQDQGRVCDKAGKTAEESPRTCKQSTKAGNFSK